MEKTRVFLITSHYMGVLYIDEILKAGDEIVGVAAWPGEAGFYEGWYVPKEYDVRSKAFQQYLPLYEPSPWKLNSQEFLSIIRGLKPDYIISGYYGKIFSNQLLSIPTRGCINIHPTGLPRYRGLSPYFTHMLFGDSYNYITMHWLDPGVDTGDIIGQAKIEILDTETGFECGHRVTEAGAAMFRDLWPKVKSGTAPRVKQDESQASIFNFSWDIAEINWEQSAIQIWNLVRCLTKPLGGAWTMAAGYKMHVWKVRIVEEDKHLLTPGAIPGQLLALTGRGAWVQCGEGQVLIEESSFDELTGVSLFDVLTPLPEGMRILLG